MSGALFNQSDITSDNSPYTALQLLLDQYTSDMQTAAIVRVVSCTSSGAVAIAGTVNVLPLVALVDGALKTYPHGVVNNLLYWRMQAGSFAIIADPVAGDIGLAVFANRDTTHVRAAKAPAPPGSSRRFSWSDGIYLGGILNAAPTNFIQVQGNNVTVTCTGTLNLNGTLLINGTPFLAYKATGVMSGTDEGTGLSAI